MDELDIKIQKIKQLRMVHIYELSGGNVKDLTQSNTAMVVYANEDEIIHLNSMDAHFQRLVQKVMEVYREAEHPEDILADDVTRRLLEEGRRSWTDDELDKYCNATPVDLVIPFESVLHKRFLPIAVYYIKSLYQLLGQEFHEGISQYGWRRDARIIGSVGTKEVSYLTQFFSERDGSFKIRIAGFPEEKDELHILVHLRRDHIDIAFSTLDHRLYGSSSFLFQTESMVQKHSVTYEGKELLLTQNEVKTEDDISPYKDMLFYEGPVHAIYLLPWKMAYVLYDQAEENQDSVLHRIGGMYIYPEAQFTELRSFVELENKSTNIRLRMDGIRVYRLRLSDGRTETYFFPEGNISSGRYQDLLAGKCFVE